MMLSSIGMDQMAMILSSIPLDRTAMMLSSDKSHGDYVIVETVVIVVVVVVVFEIDVLDVVNSCSWYRYQRHRFSSDSFILKKVLWTRCHFFWCVWVGTLTKNSAQTTHLHRAAT
jgi:hypothetical protein